MAFGFGAGEDIVWVRDRLISYFGEDGPIRLRTPIAQLVKSSISGRTRDEVSLSAYHRLLKRYPNWSDLADARASDVEDVIGAVTFPDVKARHLRDSLRTIASGHPDFDLAFLGRLTVAQALAWLERLPGVGRKVAASTLNFSTLAMPAFVVDTHVLRLLRRFGIVSDKAGIPAAFDAVMESSGIWSAVDLAELHILMKRLGQTICRADYCHCRDCPIRQRCGSRRQNGMTPKVRTVQAVPPTSTRRS